MILKGGPLDGRGFSLATNPGGTDATMPNGAVIEVRLDSLGDVRRYQVMIGKSHRRTVPGKVLRYRLERDREWHYVEP
jgi:hypothetical protein